MYGWSAVALFFVVSGFVIHLSFLNSKASTTAQFYWRRFWRIYPSYFFAMVVAAMGSGAIAGSADGRRELVTHALMVHNFFSDTFYGINPSFWSLGLEVQRYLLYPVLLAMRRRIGIERALGVTLILSLLSRIAVAPIQDWSRDPDPVLWALPTTLWFDWTLGAWLAERLHQQKEPLRMPRAAVWCLVLMWLISWHFKPTSILTFSITSGLSAIFVDRYLRVQHRPTRLESTFMAMGRSSYSFYLWHQPLIPLLLGGLTVPGLPDDPLARMTVGGLLVFLPILAWSALLHRSLEQGFMTIGQSLLERLSPPRSRERLPKTDRTAPGEPPDPVV